MSPIGDKKILGHFYRDFGDFQRDDVKDFEAAKGAYEKSFENLKEALGEKPAFIAVDTKCY